MAKALYHGPLKALLETQCFLESFLHDIWTEGMFAASNLSEAGTAQYVQGRI